MSRTNDTLKKYRQRRNLDRSLEPFGNRSDTSTDIFVVQEHAASHLHYDFRLAIGGVLVSWAVPKGPPRKTGIKRLAVATEDHPLEYATFQGSIPAGEYGAGTVEIWDKGRYTNIKKNKDGSTVSMNACLKRGTIEIDLDGDILHGPYALVRMQHMAKGSWLLMKMHK